MSIDAAPSLLPCMSSNTLRGACWSWGMWTWRTSGMTAVDHHGHGQESSTSSSEF